MAVGGPPPWLSEQLPGASPHPAVRCGQTLGGLCPHVSLWHAVMADVSCGGSGETLSAKEVTKKVNLLVNVATR